MTIPFRPTELAESSPTPPNYERRMILSRAANLANALWDLGLSREAIELTEAMGTERQDERMCALRSALQILANLVNVCSDCAGARIKSTGYGEEYACRSCHGSGRAAKVDHSPTSDLAPRRARKALDELGLLWAML